MRRDTLELLRCPFCGGRLNLVDSVFHETAGDDILHGTLGCHCCAFPVVDGIPVIHLQDASHAARQLVEARKPAEAVRRLFGIEDGDTAERFDAAIASPTSTYRDIVESLGPGFEGGYFLYRFSDPTFVVADAVVRAVAGTVLHPGDRAIDVCGGSGHLTRTLAAAGCERPFLADLYYSKLWLAMRFAAPGCEVVCCDGNSPLPFAAGAFRFAVCSDAYHYIWTKRLFAGEMMQLVRGGGTVVISHAHNMWQWNPSAGMPLPPDAYAALFSDMSPRVFGEARLLADVAADRPLDLGTVHAASELNDDPALTLIASPDPRVFAAHQPADRTTRGAMAASGHINPLYARERLDGAWRLRLQFPSGDYEMEYGACRQYLPESVVVEADVIAALESGTPHPRLADLRRQRVVLDLPARYL